MSSKNTPDQETEDADEACALEEEEHEFVQNGHEFEQDVAEFGASVFDISEQGVHEESMDTFAVEARKMAKASPWQTARRHLSASR